jgi:UDP-GlcNAc3NAcA epimerase
MKIITIIGARPQFIKASAISREIRKYNKKTNKKIEEVIIHTGQHFDNNMSEVFFTELNIPQPDFNLKISNLDHGAMTGRMLEEVEKVLQEQQPDWVIVYGDTNSTLAGVLAASKLHIPIAHIEAGLRSFNKKMPEEINRIIADHTSSLLFSPTSDALKNLKNEGISKNVYNVGDVMHDVTLYYKGKANMEIALNKWKVTKFNYVLCTIHRAENTDSAECISSILDALCEISKKNTVLLPIHPRTKKIMQNLNNKEWAKNITILEPLSYLEMLRLEMSAKVIITDSGGIQKEAFFHKIPCITIRNETEWVETVSLGWNQVVGADKELILDAYSKIDSKINNRVYNVFPYGDGKASARILNHLLNF